MPGLKIFLLGPPRVELDGAPVDLKRRKALAMLVYLVVTGQAHSRDALATLFYPDYSQSRARAYLRRDLAVLNNSLAGDWLDTDRDTIELQDTAQFWLDVERFQHYLATCHNHDHPSQTPCAECLPLLTKAVELYSGEFLAGFTLRDCPEFDDWQFFQAESLRQKLAAALESLVRGYGQQDKPELAIPYARRWVALDPLHEPAQHALIQLYDQAGQLSAALRQYEEYVQLLEEELGLPPEEDTVTLYEAIKAKKMLGSFLKAEEQARAGPKNPAAGVKPGPKGAKEREGREIEKALAQPPAPAVHQEQQIRFCTTPDGVRIAYATVGQGPILVKVANWLSHLEYEWESPVWRHWLKELAQSFTLVRYDRRGCGLSDREVNDFSLEAYVLELETVVDTLGLTRFPLLGVSGGGPVAIAYAARHPEKVSHLILYGSYARGRLYRTNAPEQVEEAQLLLKMIEVGWGKSNPAFRQVYTSLFIPEGTSEQKRWFNDLQRISTSPQIAARMFEAAFAINVSEMAPKVIAPTLILHAHDDAVVPFEESRRLAALIPGARFVPLEGKNHILLEDEPAWERFLAEVNQFVQTEFARPTLPAAAKPAPATPVQPAPASKHLVPPHHLPAQPTEFIGREEELTGIRRLLVEERNCRLLTLVGPGGIGKTRLALEAAAEASPAFAYRVYFVPLAPLTQAETIVSAIADAIGFRFYDEREPQQQLIDYLRRRRMLLVMDNFEHLLAGATLAGQILEAAPQVKILATSRERLKLKSETVYTVGGMAVPAPDGAEDALHFDAVKLFIQQVRLAQPHFEPQAADLSQVIRICRLVQGMPLGLVLAAGWAEVLSFTEIAQEIEQSLDFLQTEMFDVPERQRSLRAVFESSWKRLSAVEQQVFMKLSVFRGGFDRQAAQAVADADVQTLRYLVNKSIFTLNRAGRYEIHELLRQYGAEQLSRTGDVEQIHHRHSDYYLATLHVYQAELIGPDQLKILDKIEADLENIRVAWLHAIHNNKIPSIEQSQNSLFLFYWIRSRFQEGERAFGLALKQLTAPALNQPEIDRLRLRLSNRQGAFRYALSQTEEAAGQLQQNVELSRKLEDKKELAFALNFLGELKRTRGELEAAVQLFEESLAVGREIDDTLSIAHSLRGLGWAMGEEGSNYATAKTYYQESLVHYRAIGHQAEIAFCLDKLAYSAWQLGDYTEAETLYNESLQRFKSLGDRLGVAKALGGLALVYYSLGGNRLQEARSCAEEAVGICRDTGHELELSNRLIILGMALLKNGDLARAEQALLEAGEIAARINYVIGMALSLNNLSLVATNQGKFQEARNLHLDALKQALRISRSQDLVNILASYATLLINEVAAMDDPVLGVENQFRAYVILKQIISYPGAWQDTVDTSVHLLAELESRLPPEAREQAQIQSKTTTLTQTITDILQDSQEHDIFEGTPH